MSKNANLHIRVTETINNELAEVVSSKKYGEFRDKSHAVLDSLHKSYNITIPPNGRLKS